MENEALNLEEKVKTVLPLLVHSGAYEGPCRVGDEKSLNPEFERSRAEKKLKKFCKTLKSKLTKEGELLDPTIIEWDEDWVILREELEKLDSIFNEVDSFLIARSGLI